MTSRDENTRLAQRQGVTDWPNLIRTDALPAYTTARDVTCPEGTDCAEWAPEIRKCYCGGTSRVLADPLDTVRMAAYCGDRGAREIAGCPRCEEAPAGGYLWRCDACGSTLSVPKRWTPGSWAGHIQRFAAKLPPHRLPACACPDCVSQGYDPGCPACGGSGGNRQIDTPAWLLVVAAVAVARECWPVVAAKIVEDRRGPLTARHVRPVLDALDACERWIAEPTQEREREWDLSGYVGLPGWVPLPHETRQANLLAAAAVIGPDRVREIASAAILARLSPGRDQ